ncbi:MAG: hypothetical protein VB101_01160 [Rhodospirillaceae bacterium]|nr:hypothetical protein [Rhodospirillaceae bacterium]
MADDASALLADLYELTGDDIGLKIGVMEAATSIRKPKRSKKKKKKGQKAHEGSEKSAARERVMKVAEYAMYNEYGTDTIEPRPAFRRTHDLREDEWFQYLDNLLNGGEDPEAALRAVGDQAVNDVQLAIEEWSDPPNKQSTIDRKQSGRNEPLIDQGDYLANISYQIVRGNHDGA